MDNFDLRGYLNNNPLLQESLGIEGFNVDVYDLFYRYENKEGQTMAGLIDNILVNKDFNGD
jgi:hypothetical protein